jgi:hypothetical protein
MNLVFSEWIGGAAPYVTGTSGALSKKFNDFNEAWADVESHLAIIKCLKKEETEAIRLVEARMAVGWSTPIPPPTILVDLPRSFYEKRR